MGASDRARTASDLLAAIPDNKPGHLTNQFVREVILSNLNVVADSAARDALYPTPVGNEKVLRIDTGNQEVADSSANWLIALTGASLLVKADGQFISDGVMNGTTAVLTSASNPFKTRDVGKLILVPGAGAAGALLTTTIASYQSAGQVTLAAVSQTAVSGGTKGQVTWGTDDTAAWVAVYAAAPAGSTIRVPFGYSLFTGTFMGGITKSLRLDGYAVSEIWGTEAQSGATAYPGVAPYIAGSVIVPCSAATDAIQVTGTGVTLHRDKLGIKFADGIAFLNTGHGIYSVPTATVSGGHENGPTGCREDTLIVWGHDGNHYGQYSINENLRRSINYRSYGGGHMYVECDSTVSSYGNDVYDACYGAVFCGGTANGFHLKSRTTSFPGVLNLIKFERPQVNMLNVPSFLTGRGIATVTSAQNRWLDEGNPQDIAIDSPDLETPTAINTPVVFGSGTTVYGNPFIMTPTGFVKPFYRSKKPLAGLPVLTFGSGAGTGPSGSLSNVTSVGTGPKNDERGQVNVTVGTSPAAADGGAVAIVTLEAWNGIGAVLLQPVFPLVSIDAKFYPKNFTANKFEVWSHLGLTAGLSYSFIYHVVE